MGDEKHNEMYAQQRAMDIRIKIRKAEIAKEKGIAFDSIDELICERHPGSSFKVTGKIPNSDLHTLREKDKDGLQVYECESCTNEQEIFEKSKAYDCPICGIVIGDFQTNPYRSPEKSWRSLAGREGYHYHCKVCGTQLGEHYWKYS